MHILQMPEAVNVDLLDIHGALCPSLVTAVMNALLTATQKLANQFPGQRSGSYQNPKQQSVIRKITAGIIVESVNPFTGEPVQTKVRSDTQCRPPNPAARHMLIPIITIMNTNIPPSIHSGKPSLTITPRMKTVATTLPTTRSRGPIVMPCLLSEPPTLRRQRHLFQAQAEHPRGGVRAERDPVDRGGRFDRGPV